MITVVVNGVMLTEEQVQKAVEQIAEKKRILIREDIKAGEYFSHPNGALHFLAVDCWGSEHLIPRNLSLYCVNDRGRVMTTSITDIVLRRKSFTE